MKHGIIVPCYNESERIDSSAFIQYAKSNPQNALCFVNGGSTDNTKDVLLNIKRMVNSANIYVFDTNEDEGKINAARQGARFLFEYTDVETIGFLDTNLSTNLSEYDGLISELEEVDLKL